MEESEERSSQNRFQIEPAGGQVSSFKPGSPLNDLVRIWSTGYFTSLFRQTVKTGGYLNT